METQEITPVTAGQTKWLNRLAEDAIGAALEGRSKEDAQRVIEAGNELSQIIKRAVSRLSLPKEDARLSQAKRLWDLGYGRELKIVSFEEYLSSIPSIPDGLIEEDAVLPLLTLDDPRLPLTVRARLSGVKHAEFGIKDGDLVPFDDRHKTPEGPYWFRAHDGRPNRNRKPSECRQASTGNLLAGTADVLLALFIHHKNVVKEGEHVMDGPGSVNREYRDVCSYLSVWSGGPELNDDGDDGAVPNYGTVVFRRE